VYDPLDTICGPVRCSLDRDRACAEGQDSKAVALRQRVTAQKVGKWRAQNVLGVFANRFERSSKLLSR